ncbi:hypothetical protein MTO96_010268 [Rhipicephalus appendiculatus]
MKEEKSKKGHKTCCVVRQLRKEKHGGSFLLSPANESTRPQTKRHPSRLSTEAQGHVSLNTTTSDRRLQGGNPPPGLPLAKINTMHLTAAINHEAGIPNSPKPFQLRIDKDQNVMVASTPSAAIEKALETLRKVNVG